MKRSVPFILHPSAFILPKRSGFCLVFAPADGDGNLHLFGAAHDRDLDGRSGQRLVYSVSKVAGRAYRELAELDYDVALPKAGHVGRAVAVYVAQLGAEEIGRAHVCTP